jgi:hypothetical protein
MIVKKSIIKILSKFFRKKIISAENLVILYHHLKISLLMRQYMFVTNKVYNLYQLIVIETLEAHLSSC